MSAVTPRFAPILLAGEPPARYRSADTWRWVGWLAPSPFTSRVTRYPAETVGPLPVP